MLKLRHVWKLQLLKCQLELMKLWMADWFSFFSHEIWCVVSLCAVSGRLSSICAQGNSVLQRQLDYPHPGHDLHGDWVRRRTDISASPVDLLRRGARLGQWIHPGLSADGRGRRRVHVVLWKVSPPLFTAVFFQIQMTDSLHLTKVKSKWKYSNWFNQRKKRKSCTESII